MSSAEDETDTTLARGRKKRRRMRACDMCRRRKVRCDGGQMPNGVCTNCITFKYKCTYVQSAPKRVPDLGYLESLETQMSEMRTLLNKYRQLYPDAELSDDLNRIVSGASPFAETASGTGPASRRPSTSTPTPSMMSPLSPPMAVDLNLTNGDAEFDLSDDEISAHNNLSKSFQNLSLYKNHHTFQGKSSSMMLVQAALESKQDYVVGAPAHVNEQGATPESEVGSSREVKVPLLLETKRIEYWKEHSWVLEAMYSPTNYIFPPADLMLDLISLYFTEYNIYTPLLHRPTFDLNLKSGLHLQDNGFGAVVLIVCALGSRASDDPRVLLDVERSGAEKNGTSDSEQTYHSAGWEWFDQVRKSRLEMTFLPGTLYDMQVAYLVAVYAWGTPCPSLAWYIVGHGLRLAQSLGMHRNKSYRSQPTAEEELRKRAFWSLLHLDRLHGSVLGRPCAIQDEDFDVDLPVACDDEYWSHPDPAQAFKQPPDKPSQTIFFNYLLRLSQIHAFALRTVYSINKSKALMGLVGHEWRQRIVAEIDSALNQWIDSLPSHLRWDPNNKDPVFLGQSACLYSAYYTVQIVVHRPFIPSPRKPSPLSFPSLAICTNAARSCIHVMDEHWRRTHSTSQMHQVIKQYALLSSGVVLLLNIWGGKKSSTSTESMKEMQEVHKAMNIVKALEPRWYSAGRIWDILYDLANVGDLPLPQRCSQKRPRGDVPDEMSPQSSPISSERQVAGSKRVQQYQQSHQQQRQKDGQPSSSSAQSSFTLPLYSQELGRMPLHPFAEQQAAPPLERNTEPPSWSSSYTSTSTPGHAYGGGGSGGNGPIPDENMTMRQPIDPALEALLSMLSPAQYQQPHMADGNVPQDSSQFVQGSSASSATANQTVNPSMTVDTPSCIQHSSTSCFGVSPDALDSDTLAMWSSAPSGFAWDDWGTYVTNFTAPGAGSFDGQNHAPS
ncbi:fungal-specific transcription factor domain-containing protein [Cytidiella melzeri]|nr:fungal-specific transcription factor domain-containing protein [Cytidiella melzeri]